jgi:hypothetical protein
MPASPHCARPGCGGSRAAWLTYDYGDRTVWLDPPEAEPGGSSLALCPAHADRLRVPLGWACRDRRRPGGPAGSPGGPAGSPDGAAGSPDGPEPGSAWPAVAV